MDGRLIISKGELKAKISNFSNIFFGKPNISKFKFVELLPLVSCIFERKLHLKLGILRFCSLFIADSETKSAAYCNV